MSEKYPRFCPVCKKQTYKWKCPRCGVKTRRVNMERTIGDVIEPKNEVDPK